MRLTQKRFWMAAGLACAMGSAAMAADQAAAQPAPLTVKPYGYVKLDVAYDTQRTSAGNLAFFVLPEVGGKSDNEMNVTARETRVGLALTGPDVGDWKTTGKIETDFYGSGGTENGASLRMRLAYVDIASPDGWAVRAGQDWETFITVFPRIVNFSYLADAGALGIRRPQLRLTKETELNDSNKVIAKAALARSIGQDIDGGGQDDGADSGVPSLQGNLILETKLMTDKASKFSVSGHWGRETVDETETTLTGSKVITDVDAKDYNSWSLIGSVFLPIVESVSLQGSIWTGEDLTTYYGGIGQGINPLLQKSIRATGGWAQIMTDLTDKLNFNVGYGLDNPKDDDLNAGYRSKNQIIFTSLYYNFTTFLTAALEYSHMTTSYLGGSDASDNRVQGAMIFKF